MTEFDARFAAKRWLETYAPDEALTAHTAAERELLEIIRRLDIHISDLEIQVADLKRLKESMVPIDISGYDFYIFPSDVDTDTHDFYAQKKDVS